MVEDYNIQDRVRLFKKNAATRWNINEKHCHIGHLLLQAMLQEPDIINQVDGATGQSETNLSVAQRTSELANAMAKYGLKTGDTVVVMGYNHLDNALPFYACHFGGYSMCAIDPLGAGDLKNLWKYIYPKMIFCQKFCEEKVKEAFQANSDSCEVIFYDDENANINVFVKTYEGSAIDYRPAIIDQYNTAAWLILTSGTTGLQKVSIIPFSVVLNTVVRWWLRTPEKVGSVFAMSSLQWMSGLLFYIAGPIKGFMRLQTSVTSPEMFFRLINSHKPNVTVFTPYLLGRFLQEAEKYCDMSCFTHIIVGGGPVEKQLLDRISKVCKAKLIIVYSMTELLVPVFEYDHNNTPYGSTGKPYDRYEYKLVDSKGQVVQEPHEVGELYIRGEDSFFKGYINNPEETRNMITEDGWIKTGDTFYKDKENNYYFVERKRLIIRHFGIQFSPLEMEEVLKRHEGVGEVCVVDMPRGDCIEYPVVAIIRKNGNNVEFQELFDLIFDTMAQGRKLSVGFFFVDSLPITPSGKVHRSKIKEIALNSTLTVLSRNV